MTAFETKNKLTVILPVAQHNGTSNAEFITAIERTVSEIAGGYTAYDSVGGWIDSKTGLLYTDKAITLYTYCDDLVAELLLTLIPSWASLLQQIELTAELTTVKVAFVEGTRAQDLAA